jgi:hypothetical protein
MKIDTKAKYNARLSKRQQHAVPKRRCVGMVDAKHRCLLRPVDGKRCLVHGGVSSTASLVNPKCQRKTKAGTRCSRNSLPGSTYCRQHQEG